VGGVLLVGIISVNVLLPVTRLLGERVFDFV